MTKIFISCSGNLSTLIANEIKNSLPNIIQTIECFFFKDIDKGSFWREDVQKALNEYKVGLVICTPDSYKNSWLNYEAGALSITMQNQTMVCPILFNMEPTDLTEPLASFNCVHFTRDDFFKLLQTINKFTKLENTVLEKAFNREWIDLEKNIRQILQNTHNPQELHRSEKDMIKEILELTRKNYVLQKHSIHKSRNIKSVGNIIEVDSSMLYCSFCGENQHKVKKLIAGPNIFICNECVELCNSILQDINAENE